ncbi:MAG: 5-oxoprolinase, partial [Alphaproteobacteria bacterium]
STDVSHFAGAYERTFDAEVAGVRLQVPMMAVHTVAAGGGSICRFDGQRFRVGPESAGADPGPLSYGRGGPLAITDCNLMLGKLQPDFFPAVFGPAGDAALDLAAVRSAFAALADEITAATGERKSPQAIAEGFITVAVEHMARAIKAITIERGRDVTEYALVVFGGAGGQHGCLVADALGIETVLVHPMAGVLSALGMGLAALRQIEKRALDLPLDAAHEAEIAAVLDELAQKARLALVAQGAADGEITLLRQVHVRYRGSDTSLLVPFTDAAATRVAFESAHRRLYGFAETGRPVIVEAASAEAIGAGADLPQAAVAEGGPHRPRARRALYSGGRDWQAPVYWRADLARARPIKGPAIILEETATTIVEPGWQAVRTDRDDLLLTRIGPRRRAIVAGARPDPVLLEVFNNLFMSVAEQMGVVLERTAHSVNMKERLDFSCAVFDALGNLVANAPHMPVHLGSMGESVKAVIAAMGDDLRPGDSVMMNDPYGGGTHLPDVTVITPVFLEGQAGGGPDFFVAARGHHADIGGIAPGSMPSHSTRIEEEGILIPPTRIVRGAVFDEERVRRLLTAGPWPARNPEQNIADLKAQIAATARGVAEIGRLVAHFGHATVAAYMDHVRANAAESVRRVIDRLVDGEAVYPMDCGATIRVAIRVDRARRTALVDFTGTSAQHAGNFNAPRAISRAAVLYVFRCLVGEDIPLNDGCLEPITIRLPEGSLLDPKPPAAVVAGNVETSQAVTNALLLAAGAVAAAQGTMNNLTFGNERHQYYETLCGGAGAGPGFEGASAVHTHMTNSRLTDAEVLEARHPVRIERFAIREGSGGAGRWRGGDGVVREIAFLEAMEVNILSGHREIPPPGLDG